MFRARIIGLAVAGVLLLGAGVYAWSVLALSDWGETQLQESLIRAQRLMDRLKTLDEADLVGDAKKWASSDTLEDVLKGDWAVDAKGTKRTVVGELAALEVRYHEDYYLEVVLDENGEVIARNKGLNWTWKNLADAYPTSASDASKTATSPIVTASINGGAGSDLWLFEDLMVIVAAAPIVHNDVVVGVLVLGRHLSSSYAEGDKGMLGVHVSYMLDSRVHGSTLSAEEVEDLQEKLRDDKSLLGPVLGEERSVSAPVSLRLKDTDYRAIFAPYPGESSTKRSAYAVMLPEDVYAAPMNMVITPIFIFGGVALLLVIVLGLFLARGLERPPADIEEGIIEVINGNQDYKFRPQPNYMAGIAQRLNIMVASLLGRPLPDEELEEEVRRSTTGEWADPLFIDEDAVKARLEDMMHIDVESAKRLAMENEDEYYSRIFKAYTNYKSGLGQPLGGVTLDKFRQKLRNNETMLKRKYNAAMVRFVVVVKEDTVILQPVPLDAQGQLVTSGGSPATMSGDADQ
jgi:hypothetical protein